VKDALYVGPLLELVGVEDLVDVVEDLAVDVERDAVELGLVAATDEVLETLLLALLLVLLGGRH